MVFSEVTILESWTSLFNLVWTSSSLVRGSLEVVLLVVGEGGGKEVVHHYDTNVYTATLPQRGR